MKEQLKNNIDFCGNRLNLINDLDEDNFILNVNEIYNSKKKYYNYINLRYIL
jgi:hypothetical protein